MPLFQRLLHLPVLEERATPDFVCKSSQGRFRVVPHQRATLILIFCPACLVRPLSLCRDAMTTKFLGQSRARATVGLVRNVIETTRTVWYPILTRLRQLKAMRDHREQMWTYVVVLWEQFGQTCGLSSSDRLTREPVPWGSHLVKLQNPRSVRRGCSLDSCMCMMAPSHKLKVCKGCWRAFYCSERCQAQ